MKINLEFQKLIPPLTDDELNILENSCLTEGIREPILTWDGFIIDGHNRYNIAKKHNLQYKTAEKVFDNEQAVKEWMILNQFGRRNLNNYQRSMLALELEEMFREKAKEKQKKSGGAVPLKSAEPPIETRQELAKVANVGKDTIDKVKTIKEKASPEIKEKLITGEMSINQAHKEIKKEEKIQTLEVKKKEYKEKTNAELIYKPKVYLMDAVDYLNTFEDNSIDLLLTDPPYATSVDDIHSFTKKWLSVALKKIKQTGRAYICSGAYPVEMNAFLSVLMNQDKFIVDSPLIWTYRNTLGITPKNKYNLNYQVIWHLFTNKSPNLDTSITNEMFSVQDINAPDGRLGNRLHTWQKPDELANRLVKHGSKENDLVIDCFSCTGTFLLAAARFNRLAFGCDINLEHLKIAEERGCTIIGEPT